MHTMLQKVQPSAHAERPAHHSPYPQKYVHCNVLRELTSVTFVNVDLQDLAFPCNFASLAVLASVLGTDPLALPLTVMAYCLDLLDHAWSQLLDANLHPSTTAGTTVLHSTLLTTSTCSMKRSQYNGEVLQSKKF